MVNLPDSGYYLFKDSSEDHHGILPYLTSISTNQLFNCLFKTSDGKFPVLCCLELLSQVLPEKGPKDKTKVNKNKLTNKQEEQEEQALQTGKSLGVQNEKEKTKCWV